MNCKFAEKVSVFVDNELTEREAEKIKKHIAICQECQNLEKDFLFFRRQIKESVSNINEVPQNNLKKTKAFFSKKISIPIPVFAGIILTFFGIGTWFLMANSNRPTENLTKVKSIDQKETQEQSFSDKFSLGIYDKGGKAEIYVVPQQNKPR